MAPSILYCVIASLEVLTTILTLFLSVFLKADPTRSFVLAVIIPVTFLTLTDVATIIGEVLQEQYEWSLETTDVYLQWVVSLQFVWNNTAVLTFLIGSLVFLFTSAYVVRNKRVPPTWPLYIPIVIASIGLSIAEVFKHYLLNIPQYILHGSFCLAAASMVILMIAIPIYTHFTTVSTMANTTDQAIFNAKWRLFWAYLYLIIPSIRSIFVIIKAIGELDPKWSANKGPFLLAIQSAVDLAGSLFYLIPVYFFLPAYRSCLFYCYKSREMNPHFFFVKVIPQKGKDRRISIPFNKVSPVDGKEGARAVELQETSLEDVHENHRYRRTTRLTQSRSPSPPMTPIERTAEVDRRPSIQNRRQSMAARNEQYPNYPTVRVPLPPPPPPNQLPFAHGELGTLIHHPKIPPPLPPLRNTHGIRTEERRTSVHIVI